MPRARGGRKTSQGRGRKNASKAPPVAIEDMVISDEESISTIETTSQRKKTSRGRGRKNASRAVPIADSDVIMCDEDCVSTLETLSRSRGGSQVRSRRNPRASRSNMDVEDSIDLTCSDEEEFVVSPDAQPQITSGRRSLRRSARTRPTVVSLDVTYSSDEFEDELSSNKSFPSPERNTDLSLNLVLTPSPNRHESDESLDETVSPTETEEEKKSPTKTVNEISSKDDFLSSDSDEDLFSIDYNMRREKALKSAYKEISVLEKKQPIDITSNEDSIIKLHDVDSGQEFGILDSSLCSPVKIKKRMKRSRKMNTAHKNVKKFYEEMATNQTNNSFNTDATILSDDEDTANESITLLVKWESNYIRWPVRKFQKFSSVYKEVADRFSLDIAQVLLCHNDKVISHEVCPKDLQLDIGDIIEGGIQSLPTSNGQNAVKVLDPDTIPLKVQNSDRKGMVTIHIKRSSKMIELMHRYAEEKNIKVENLRFSFDGESLDPSDTPETLDLDGGECIDVFTK